ncbi:hypothetical protein Pmar_PMAR004827 [Perkinsus marinus ATCC 50983]|uniref:GSKIP domain-containing protein n=1 Tax=Perkinsus marinus (strain ATCC 50983 / TXsc) TaxID=423536 RepID=C5LLA5_PERM5|nr:hypothetical protein Pmar_PMAR004827 [Perkinsus marinus ATCC 50983]EER02464.1 hypothetical protein Pmar_PMAR004827 [Perkinsus marinus ATCC 50983]|eukprot:XP_002769746.1 hypothetical protein Pmar_PMAR004827 [Perkinsus marinus ATCC 50983]
MSSTAIIEGECSTNEEDVLKDVDYIMRHYSGYFHQMEITNREKDSVTFRLIPNDDKTRELIVVLNRSHFILEGDSSTKPNHELLIGRRFETIEQLLSAVMGAHHFGQMLNSLLVTRLESLESSPRSDNHCR